MSNILDKLEALAKDATPGPWYAEEDEVRHDYDPYCSDEGIADCSVNVCRISNFGSKDTSDREFIAAANPETILRLCGVVRSCMVALECAQETMEIEGITCVQVEQALQSAKEALGE